MDAVPWPEPIGVIPAKRDSARAGTQGHAFDKGGRNSSEETGSRVSQGDSPGMTTI